MWWLPLATASGLALIIAGLHFWHQRSRRDSAKVYRARYLQLISQLEGATQAVNRLAQVAPRLKDDKLLDYYESCLRLLETLLQAVRRVPPFGAEPGLLNSAFFLVRDCNERVERAEKAFRESLKGRDIDLDGLYGRPKPARALGCYFCSRPLISDRFSMVKVRIDGDVREVLSCKICQDELRHTKKIKVLYFLKDGRPVHWSEMPGYQPDEHYWNINKKGIMRPAKLELVYSRKDDHSSHST